VDWLLAIIGLFLTSLVGTHTGINIPDSCTDCPDYAEIALIYPDNSNQAISGDFNSDGTRNNFFNSNHYKWYLYQPEDKQFWWIDPPADTMSRIKLITIQPVTIWKGDASLKLMMNDTRVTFEHTRWVDDNCRKAVIDVDSWIFTLGDTINYLHNDCDPKYTNLKTNMTMWYNSTIPIEKDLHKHYQYLKWVEKAKESCLEKC
jgi:hypothetical protein